MRGIGGAPAREGQAVRNGRLRMLNRNTLGRALAAVSAIALLSALPLATATAADAGMKQWTKGKGWGSRPSTGCKFDRL